MDTAAEAGVDVSMISSRVFLLPSPNSFFAGLISRHLVLFLKFGLLSLMVIKEGRQANIPSFY